MLSVKILPSLKQSVREQIYSAPVCLLENILLVSQISQTTAVRSQNFCSKICALVICVKQPCKNTKLSGKTLSNEFIIVTLQVLSRLAVNTQTIVCIYIFRVHISNSVHIV